MIKFSSHFGIRYTLEMFKYQLFRTRLVVGTIMKMVRLKQTINHTRIKKNSINKTKEIISIKQLAPCATFVCENNVWNRKNYVVVVVLFLHSLEYNSRIIHYTLGKKRTFTLFGRPETTDAYGEL